MSFDGLGLAPELLRAVADAGYAEPTPIQREAIPLGLDGRDVVGSAQTGTGKTAAFMLPMLQRLMGQSRGKTRALVLCPTRELAEQVLQNTKAYGAYTSVTAVAVYGGVAMGPQTTALRKRVDIIIATPGRLLDHMERGHVDLSDIEVLVLDEADRMLDMGFAKEVNRILDRVPKDHQTMLFSATISGDVDRLARRAMNDHAAVEIGRRAETAVGVEHMLVAVDKSNKRSVLAKLLLDMGAAGRTLVFTRTKHGAERLTYQLKRAGVTAIALHGDKTQRERTNALGRFKNGEMPVLVATDVAARGIDVDDIVMVVNYDVPNDPEVYVHRVGRTARAGAEGIALTLMSPDEWLLMRGIERLMGKELRRQVIPGFEPAVMPAQPEERREQIKPKGRTLGPRGGGRRRR